MTARNALDRMKQQGSAKAKENRTKRKVEKNKEYGKSGLSSSDMAYINGNYKKVASNKAYGYRQGVKKGEIVRGSESDWLSDGNIRRTSKVKENESWKNPTNKKGKQKYAILSSHKWDKAKNFNEQLNTGTLDGLKTAKANQRKGKHVNNALEWVKGGAKDFLVDPAVDFMKSVGAIGSYGLAGIAGIAEDSGNLAKAVADPKRDYKYYSQGRSNLKENLKANKEELDRTGFGKDMGSFLHDAKKRGEEETVRLLKEDGRGNEVKEYKKQIEKNKKRDTNLLNATGFVMDLIAPTVVEDKVVDVVKGLGKNSVKSFKQLKNGTANLATGIVPEETAKLMANSRKYAGKGNKITGASDDVFYSGKKGKTATDKLLDNQFEKTMDNVKDVVKKNPNTSNLGKFLDTLDDKPLKGTQRKIDGRTLNKKYTQTKDGYIPNLMNNVDEIGDVVKGSVNGQYSMFGKDGSMNAYIDNIQNPYARYEKVINKYGDDIDGLINKIDSMSPHNADATLDYLRKTRPEVYEQVVKGSDEITDMIESTTRRRGYETQQKIKDDNKYFKTQDVNTPKFSAEELARQKYIKENNYKLLKDVFNPKFVDNVGNIKEREGLLRTGVKNFAQKVSTLAGGSLEEASVQIKNAKYLVDKGEIGAHEVSKMLNDLFFDGKDVVRRNVTPRHANQLLDYVDDMIVKQANGVLEELDSLGNKIPVGEGARKISASLTDYRYDEKMSNLASHFGVKNKAELTDRYKELQLKKKTQPLNTDEFYEYKELGEKIAKWDDEYKKVKYMSDEYDDYAKKAYGKKDGTEGYKEALNELADSGKNKRLSYEEFVAEQNTSKTALDKTLDAKEWQKEVNKRWEEYKLDLDGAVDERNLELVRGERMRNQLREGASSNKNNNVGQNSRARQEMLDQVGEHSIPKYTTQDLQKMKDIQKRAETIRKALNLPETKPMKVKLTKGQKLGDLPPVRENLAHLKKTIQKEIRYMFENPDKYEHFEEGFKHIKQGYVNTLRGYGVPDDKYFHKVKALQDELKGKMNDILKGGTENTPLLKMELQKLASRVDETFKGFDDVVLDKIDDVNIKTFDDVVTDLNKTNNPFDEFLSNINKTDEYVDDFERVIEQENIKHSEELREKLGQNSNTPKKRAEIDPRTEERLKYYESKLNLPEPKTLLDDIELPPGVDEDGVIQDLTKTLDNKSSNKTPTFEQFKETVSKNSNGKLPYEDEKLYGVYKSWLNSWKKGLTVYNPGWHIQNFFQNKGQNYLALGADALKPQTEARNILKQMNGKKAKDVNIFDSKNLRSYSSDEIGKLAQELGVIDGLGEDVKNTRGIFPKFEQWVDNTPLMKTLEKNEQTARLHHFIEQIKRGNTPEEAVNSVNKYLFDYSNKSNADKVMGDFVDPFWTFHKNNAKLMYGSMFEHPSKINSIIRGTNGLENGIPDEQRQNEESKYGKLQKPYANFTDSVNGDQYNYLYKQNMFPDVEDAIPLEDEALENKMNPILRMLMQQSRGEGNFGNKIVEEGEKPGWNEITKEQRVKEVLMDLNPFMPNLVKTLDSEKNRQQKADDEKQSQEITDKQILMDWINYITGNKGNWYRNLDL